MNDLIRKAARLLIETDNAVALTGAGVSVESGIPPFRGKGGLWEEFDPMEYAHIDSFLADPAKVWKVLLSRINNMLNEAKPNYSHIGLAKLEEMGILKAVITQNVDGLHFAGGSKNVIEFHGNFAWQVCLKCQKRLETSKITLDKIPPECECGGIYKPDAVFFGEMINPANLMRARELSAQCDVMLVMGTSATVEPSAYMPYIAKQGGAVIIEINPEKTPLTNSVASLFIKGKSGEIMKAVIAEIDRLKS